MAVLLAFVLPPLLQLKQVPALRVLRREIGLPRDSGLATLLLGVSAIAALVVAQAGDAKLGGYVLAGLALTVAAAAGLAFGLTRLLARLRGGGRGGWRIGLATSTGAPAAAWHRPRLSAWASWSCCCSPWCAAICWKAGRPPCPRTPPTASSSTSSPARQRPCAPSSCATTWLALRCFRWCAGG